MVTARNPGNNSERNGWRNFLGNMFRSALLNNFAGNRIPLSSKVLKASLSQKKILNFPCTISQLILANRTNNFQLLQFYAQCSNHEYYFSPFLSTSVIISYALGVGRPSSFPLFNIFHTSLYVTQRSVSNLREQDSRCVMTHFVRIC